MPPPLTYTTFVPQDPPPTNDLTSNTTVTQVVDVGVVAHEGSYLRDVWNMMDAVVVICAIMSFVFAMT